jgi:hypothetical protein
MTEGEQATTADTGSKADKRIIQYKIASEAAPPEPKKDKKKSD